MGNREISERSLDNLIRLANAIDTTEVRENGDLYLKFNDVANTKKDKIYTENKSVISLVESKLADKSLLKLEEIQIDKPITLICSGADLLDGTPVIDIKPYIPFVEAKPNAPCAHIPFLHVQTSWWQTW